VCLPQFLGSLNLRNCINLHQIEEEENCPRLRLPELKRILYLSRSSDYDLYLKMIFHFCSIITFFSLWLILFSSFPIHLPVHRTVQVNEISSNWTPFLNFYNRKTFFEKKIILWMMLQVMTHFKVCSLNFVGFLIV
jgi:hypothetical protein